MKLSAVLALFAAAAVNAQDECGTKGDPFDQGDALNKATNMCNQVNIISSEYAGWAKKARCEDGIDGQKYNFWVVNSSKDPQTLESSACIEGFQDFLNLCPDGGEAPYDYGDFAFGYVSFPG